MEFTLVVHSVYTGDEREFRFEAFSLYRGFHISLDILDSRGILSSYLLGKSFVSLICDGCVFYLSHSCDGDFSWSICMHRSYDEQMSDLFK